MRLHIRFLLSALWLGGSLAQAADGLSVPPSAWQHWQARVAVSTYEQSPRLAAASLLGDYYFRGLRLGDAGTAGGFRATSGLMLGAGTAPLGAAGVPARLGPGPTLGHLVLAPMLPGTESPDAGTTRPYLGLGFTSISAGSGIAFSADVGLVARSAWDTWGEGRTWLGPQGLDATLRSLRLTPVLQIGLRYTY
jgi:hypothetical protein